MTDYDPWAELERLARLERRAFEDGDEDAEYDCKLARRTIEREIRKQNLGNQPPGACKRTGRPRTIKGAQQRHAAILNLIQDRPMYATNIAKALNMPEGKVSNMLIYLRRRGDVCCCSGKWMPTDG